jgi:hypothetical protein
MRARSWLFGTLCLLLPLAFACSRPSQSSSPSRNGTSIETSQASDRAKGDRVIAGQLRAVHPDRHTLIVAFGDDLHEFAYTDSTEVVGGATANVRGLTGNAGNEITVHYRENPFTSTKTAVRIELQ